MGEQQEKMNRAKAFCFDNSVTEQKMEIAWENAIKAENKIIKNLDSHGQYWWHLPTHLLKQLNERYGGIIND